MSKSRQVDIAPDHFLNTIRALRLVLEGRRITAVSQFPGIPPGGAGNLLLAIGRGLGCCAGRRLELLETIMEAETESAARP